MNNIDIEAKGNELKKAVLETGEVRGIFLLNHHSLDRIDQDTYYCSVKEIYELVRNIFNTSNRSISMFFLDREEQFDSEKNVKFFVDKFEILTPKYCRDDLMVSYALDFHSQYDKYDRYWPSPAWIEEIIIQNGRKFINLKCDNCLYLNTMLRSENIKSQINEDVIRRLSMSWHIIMKIHVPNLDTFDCLKI